MKKITIVGFGRFGKTLYRLLKDDFIITLYNRSRIDTNGLEPADNTTIAQSVDEIYKSDVIFYAVPIAAFESVIEKHKKYFTPQHLLIDVLSVKMYPAAVFTKYLKNMQTQALLTHPMFGPDSSKDGFAGLPMIIDTFKADNENYTFWKEYFHSKQLRVIEISAQEHDTLAAKSQGVTHFIGRLLEEYNFQETPIDSLGAKKLQQIKEQTCNDTWELFTNLQQYNPYTKQMRIKLGIAYDKLYNKLLPKQVNPDYITYGIQGGRGSFNEEMLHNYITQKNITQYRINYLYTSEKVLSNLYEGNIDYGLFAIHNSLGGPVHESFQAMSRYKFTIIEELDLLIRHFLMKRKEIAVSEITTIMAHPQVLLQCKQTLKEKYPNIKQESGTGDLLDTAKAAYALAKDDLPPTTAILGPRVLSTLYNFDIITEDLQDRKDNITHFLLVSR